MSYQKFTKNAVRTEARIDSVACDQASLMAVLSAAVSVGEMMDAIKKTVFYGKMINPGDFCVHAQKLVTLGEELKTGWNPTVKQHVDIDPRVFHGIIGKFTESVELLEAMIKGMKTGKLDTVNIKEEMGDDQWYSAILCDTLGINMDSVLERVIEKLKVRYPEKFTAEAAINRDLTSERNVLEM
jgi:NTP pyrophosphatase (non-canonical NTP hydrolase)